jgi:hypothetical protein
MMRPVNLFFFTFLCAFGCADENAEPTVVANTRLQSEEYFSRNAVDPDPISDFVALYKKTYYYNENKLVQIDLSDFNPTTHTYDSAYKLEEYHYMGDGRLSQRVEFIGPSGLKWIKEYEYPNETTTRVTRYESTNSGVKNLQDWWIMEKTPSSLTVKYYQGNNELYAQLLYTIDDTGNVISLTADPSFPLGKIYYEHDTLPNPYKFPELVGEYGFDSEKYLSENNLVTVTTDSDMKSTRMIEYNDNGYPVAIITSTSKRIFVY